MKRNDNLHTNQPLTTAPSIEIVDTKIIDKVNTTNSKENPSTEEFSSERYENVPSGHTGKSHKVYLLGPVIVNPNSIDNIVQAILGVLLVLREPRYRTQLGCRVLRRVTVHSHDKNLQQISCVPKLQAKFQGYSCILSSCWENSSRLQSRGYTQPARIRLGPPHYRRWPLWVKFNEIVYWVKLGYIYGMTCGQHSAKNLKTKNKVYITFYL